MRAMTSYSETDRVSVTAQGHLDLLTAETCPCNQLLVTDGLYQCPRCKTVYGVVMAITLPRQFLGKRGH